MRYHIKPMVKTLGIEKCAGWHTLRSPFTSLLTDNTENVKVVQQLLRQASVLMTMDAHAQVKMQDKRRAQLRVVEETRPPQKKTA